MESTDRSTRRSILSMAAVIVLMGCGIAVTRRGDEAGDAAAVLPAPVPERVEEVPPPPPQPVVVEPVPPEPNDNAAPPEGTPDPFTLHVAIQQPTDAQLGWVRIVEQSDVGQSSTVDARYEPDNEFRFTTHNVEQIRLDQAQLPVRKARRFIVHLDGQDMAVNPPQQGMVTFKRDSNGIWEYVKP